MVKRIFLASPNMSKEGYEQKYVKEAFDTNWVAPLGENVNKFEEELAKYVGIKHAAALSSGTAAIHMAFKALDVKQGDIVFCSDLTFSATVNPVLYQNAVPVFIDNITCASSISSSSGSLLSGVESISSAPSSL